MPGQNGGRRQGAGRKPNVEGRIWCREVVDDPEIRALVVKALRQQLAKNDTSGYESLFRHGYGAPPSTGSLSVALGAGDGPVEFRCTFDDGAALDVAIAAPAPVPAEIPE